MCHLAWVSLAETLAQWRSRQDLTLEEMVDLTHRLLAHIAPHQTRYKVSERPDARTIRYYISRGLLPKPLGYQGGRARYGNAHLVFLLLIKRLQAEHYTLDQITRTLAGLDAQRAQALLLAEKTAPAAPALPEGTRPVAAAGLPEGRFDAVVLAVAPGGQLVVPSQVVASSKERVRLAENLEALAARLRASCLEPTPEGDDDGATVPH